MASQIQLTLLISLRRCASHHAERSLPVEHLQPGQRQQAAAAACVCIMALQGTLYGFIALRAKPEQWTQEPSRVAAAVRNLKATYAPGVTFVVNNYAEPMTTYAPDFHFVSTIDGGTLAAQPWEKLGPHYLLVYTKTLTEPLPNICLRTLAQDFRVSCDILVGTPDR